MLTGLVQGWLADFALEWTSVDVISSVAYGSNKLQTRDNTKDVCKYSACRETVYTVSKGYIGPKHGSLNCKYLALNKQ